MAKLGSKQNPFILNVHDLELAQEITDVCTKHDWHFILGCNPNEPIELMDLINKLEPPTLQYSGPRTQRNDPCPCGSGRKFKKCCLLNAELCGCGEPIGFHAHP